MTAKKKNRTDIVSLVTSLPDGTHIVEHANGKLERQKSLTDWKRLDALTDEQIEEAVRRDPDAVPLDFNWDKAVLVVRPKKQAISIRVDEDVLDYFKTEGAGYQRRMNAVLRSYMQQKKSKKTKKRA
ncbi:MAG TPA: BrnA antitoxin family protein [Roseiarcus sp.]|nr:BrnA antitoxin family protein [Roseiarcus sp.]